MVFAYIWAVLAVPNNQLIDICVCFVNELCRQSGLIIVTPRFVVKKNRTVGCDDTMEFVNYLNNPTLIFVFGHVVVVLVVINIVLLPYLITVLSPTVLYSFFVIRWRSYNSIDC